MKVCRKLLLYNLHVDASDSHKNVVLILTIARERERERELTTIKCLSLLQTDERLHLHLDSQASKLTVLVGRVAPNFPISRSLMNKFDQVDFAGKYGVLAVTQYQDCSHLTRADSVPPSLDSRLHYKYFETIQILDNWQRWRVKTDNLSCWGTAREQTAGWRQHWRRYWVTSLSAECMDQPRPDCISVTVSAFYWVISSTVSYVPAGQTAGPSPHYTATTARTEEKSEKIVESDDFIVWISVIVS